LIEQGKITFETEVGDYLPQMKNPIIVENKFTGQSTPNMAFRPATKAVTVQHLMNFTSGLFCPELRMGCLGEGYTSKDMHQAANPVSRFFKIIKVCRLSSLCNGFKSIDQIQLIREDYLPFH